MRAAPFRQAPFHDTLCARTGAAPNRAGQRRAASVHALVFLAGLVTGLLACLMAGQFGRGPLPAPAEAAADPGQPVSQPVSQASAPAPASGSYVAEVTRVIDGDTVEARVAVWMGQEVVTKVRLRGIDAPEIRGACGPEREKALAARDSLAGLLGKGQVTLSEIGPDKYFGRVVARLRSADGRDAGAALLAAGLARPYDGRRRDSWCALP